MMEWTVKKSRDYKLRFDPEHGFEIQKFHEPEREWGGLGVYDDIMDNSGIFDAEHEAIAAWNALVPEADRLTAETIDLQPPWRK